MNKLLALPRAVHVMIAVSIALAVSSAGAVDPALDQAVAAWAAPDKPPAYRYALSDLNVDGQPDAVVLVTDPCCCGSGGCNMLVFRGTSTGFKLVSESTITREPIYVLTEIHLGWHTLSVLVSGGGADEGQVLMQFNGKAYPDNPSMQKHASAAGLKKATRLALQ